MFKFISQFFNYSQSNDDSQRNRSHREPQKISQRPIRHKKKGQDSLEFIHLIENWKNVVGPQLVKHTIPLKMNYKCLVILTRHSAYSQELQFMSEAIKEKITSLYPNLGPTIDKIYFKSDPSFFVSTQENSLDGENIRLMKEQNRNHPFSPHHQKLRKMAMESVGELEDKEMQELLISLHIQQAEANSSKSND